MMLRSFFGTILFLFVLPLQAQTTEVREKCDHLWSTYTDNEFISDNVRHAKAIHLQIDKSFSSTQLEILSNYEFGVFLNGNILLRTVGKARVNLDSVLKAGNPKALLSIYTERTAADIETFLIRNRKVSEFDNQPRQSAYFKDFLIIACISLFAFFVVLFRTNTNLMMDYVSISKVFSLQNREELNVVGRIGSSSNILFYIFISFTNGLLLEVVFFNTKLSAVVPVWFFQSLGFAFLSWLLLSLIILAILICRLVLMEVLSALFNFKETIRFQFFTFVRSLYIGALLMVLIFVVCTTFKLETAYCSYVALISALTFMALSSLFLTIKLLTKTQHSVFHLFSYLCSSEIIPIMIFVKVLLF